MLLERLLSMATVVGGKVAYLELDVGQSDFGPPGVVALHVFSLADNVQGGIPEEVEIDDADPAGTSPEDGSLPPNLRPLRTSNRTPSLATASPSDPAGANHAYRSCTFLRRYLPPRRPREYVAAVHDLIEYFRSYIQPGQSTSSEDPHRVPLIVNTQGWVKGLGADLAARLEPMLRPTHILTSFHAARPAR